jgi:hypothetical protein
MHPSPNLQHIAQQTSEVASKCTDQRWQLAFQTVSVVSMAVLGVGTAVHLLREMLRQPHHKSHSSEKSEHDRHGHRRWSERAEHEDAEEDHHHRHRMRRSGTHGHHRG